MTDLDEDEDTIFQRILARKKKSVQNSPAITQWTKKTWNQFYGEEDEEDEEKEIELGDDDPLVIKKKQLKEEEEKVMNAIAKRKAFEASKQFALAIMQMENDDLKNAFGRNTQFDVEYLFDRINLVLNDTVLRSFIPKVNDMAIECYFEDCHKVRIKESESKRLQSAMSAME